MTTNIRTRLLETNRRMLYYIITSPVVIISYFLLSNIINHQLLLISASTVIIIVIFDCLAYIFKNIGTGSTKKFLIITGVLFLGDCITTIIFTDFNKNSLLSHEANLLFISTIGNYSILISYMLFFSLKLYLHLISILAIPLFPILFKRGALIIGAIKEKKIWIANFSTAFNPFLIATDIFEDTRKQGFILSERLSWLMVYNYFIVPIMLNFFLLIIVIDNISAIIKKNINHDFTVTLLFYLIISLFISLVPLRVYLGKSAIKKLTQIVTSKTHHA